MKKLLLFGATGHLGGEIARTATAAGYEVTAVVRNDKKSAVLKDVVHRCVVHDPQTDTDLEQVCSGYDTVISALGKSVSPFDRSKGSFMDIDLGINRKILQAAKQAGVKKFVYISALEADQFPHLDYFLSHHLMASTVKESGLEYLIIEPPALYSAFLDLMTMAAKGWLMHIGEADHLTNPISERDLAEICVQSLSQSNIHIAAGGPEILSRRRLNEIVQETVDPQKKIRTIPIGLLKTLLPLIRVFDKSSFDKISFFLAVVQRNTIAPIRGKEKFADYVRREYG